MIQLVALFQIAVYVGSAEIHTIESNQYTTSFNNVSQFEDASSLLARISAAVTDVASISALWR